MTEIGKMEQRMYPPLAEGFYFTDYDAGWLGRPLGK